MITLRPAAERGHANHGWLDTWHTFSFASYRDERHMGFSVLRVINQDRVQPGRGFAPHAHADMEILSYVLDGVLEHEDSMGNGSRILPGEVQFMSAGSGVTHSEFNGSETGEVHFLQMWVLPSKRGTTPRYDQRRVFDGDDDTGFARVVSPDGRDGAIRIGADVRMYVGRLRAGDHVVVDLESHRRAWLHLARGALTLQGVAVQGVAMEAGDGAAVADEERLVLEATAPAELVLFDLP